MSNLIPTPVVDKNGKRTTVHKKDTGSSSAAILGIPPVTAASAPKTDSSNKNVITLLNSDDLKQKDIIKCLDYMRSDDEETIPMAVHLMTHGHQTARDLVVRRFRFAVTRMTETLNDSPPEEDEFWYELCPESWSDQLQPDIAKEWALGSVMSEYGNARSTYQSVRTSMGYFDMKLRDETGEVERSRDVAYWRGLAALSLGNSSENDTPDEWATFARWAGRHDDISLIINTAKERGTVNVDTLEGIMGQRNDVHSSLHEGIL